MKFLIRFLTSFLPKDAIDVAVRSNCLFDAILPPQQKISNIGLHPLYRKNFASTYEDNFSTADNLQIWLDICKKFFWHFSQGLINIEI